MAAAADPKKDPPAAAPKPRAWLAPLLWIGAGAALTLAIVLVLRATEPAPKAGSTTSAAPAATSARVSSLGKPGEEFAALYLAYLLKSYYVDERGFCQNLLRAICAALVTTDLVANEKSCATVPNTEMVLAIGRFQNGVGLPVDGKAGPETVRMILGGDFGSRKDMSNKYCPGPTPSAPAP